MRPKCVLLAFALIILLAPFAQGEDSPAKGSFLVYAGTYTGPPSKGIYAFRFDPASGKSTSMGLVAETTNPSFLAIDPSQHYLYAVNEVGDYKGKKSGGVSAFSLDRKTGKRTKKLRSETWGSGPLPCCRRQNGQTCDDEFAALCSPQASVRNTTSDQTASRAASSPWTK